MAKKQSHATSSQEDKEVRDRTAPGGKIVYKAILLEGRQELERSTSALFYSGIAAGLSMGFSFLSEGLLQAHLADTPWRPLVSSFGYSMGFLIVVLGRQQLFTENTLTPILPLLVDKRMKILLNVLRLWTVVLIANLLGAFFFAWAVSAKSLFPENVHSALLELAQTALKDSFWIIMFKGLFAGWLIALMVWLLPFAEAGRIWVIIFVTYIVGLANLSHVIAGSVEVFFAGILGQESWLHIFGGYILPTLIGNALGGVILVAVLNHAQVVAGEEGQDL
ncbi:MAG TPA: formate/nitrite transporter family protein [Tepidisphaeraceae bacterium]|jgi:formate/nitrite transporter FocA (FNT family)